MTRKRQALLLFLSFVGGAVAAILVPPAVRYGLGRVLFPIHSREVARTTSPDGAVDAVTVEINCGVPCPLEDSISIVPRGRPALAEPGAPVFTADYVANLRVQWLQPHLLGIGYDQALVQDFHNTTYPFEHPGIEERARYGVEIRLEPSSPRFSYLKGFDEGKPTQ